MTNHLTDKDKVDIIEAYTIKLEPMISIAKRYKRSRQGIWKVLKHNGINIADCGKMDVSCTACGNTVKRHRNRIRKIRHHFCDTECYYAYIEAMQNGKYNQSRQGQRVARSVVSQYLKLEPGMIVHHEDRNTLNNTPRNLKVFRTHGDHIRYHRWSKDGIFVEPAWDGAKL